MSASSQKEREWEKEYATTSTLYILIGVVSMFQLLVIYCGIDCFPLWWTEVRWVRSLYLREYVHCISCSSFWCTTHHFMNSKCDCSVFNHCSKDRTASVTDIHINEMFHTWFPTVDNVKPNYHFHQFCNVVLYFVYIVYIWIIYLEIWSALHFFRALKKPKTTNSVNQFHERRLTCYVWNCDW